MTTTDKNLRWSVEANSDNRREVILANEDGYSCSLSVASARGLATGLHEACNQQDCDDGIDECLRPIRQLYWQNIRQQGKNIAQEAIEKAIADNPETDEGDLKDTAKELVSDMAFGAADGSYWAIYTRQAILVRLFCSSDADANAEELGATEDSAYAAAALQWEYADAAMSAIDEWEKPAVWRLAPASEPTDYYAAGYDGNKFASQAEAEAAIPGLRALGGDFDIPWIAVEDRE